MGLRLAYLRRAIIIEFVRVRPCNCNIPLQTMSLRNVNHHASSVAYSSGTESPAAPFKRQTAAPLLTWKFQRYLRVSRQLSFKKCKVKVREKTFRGTEGVRGFKGFPKDF
ncbi:hypothetical protein CEXT_668351 [Caerostris extrusa]|uniref:Uncharacterized protein n=1 Tax=Caerostris extrusa TaxID=172846 RepID=A0AAV4UBF4_CAEEX|nr:hypothetical protein CEXT_668351 [Caerostris extrusa]